MSYSLPDWAAVDWHAHHRVIDAAGQPIHIVEQGPSDAPAVLFIHGWTGCWQHWVKQFAALSGDHRVVAMDLPGFGGSPMPPAREISIEGYAAVVVDVLDALGIERATLVGSSMGGGVAAQATLDSPERVERLALVSATGIAPRYMGFPSAFVKHRVNRPVMNVVFRESPLPTRLAYKLASRPRLRQAALSLFVADPSALSGPISVELISGAGRPAAAAACVALASHEIFERLAEIDCPTLVLWGDKDRVVGPSCAQRYADAIGGAELVVYEGIGHLPFIEAPQRFNEDIRRFLERENGHTSLNVTSIDVTS